MKSAADYYREGYAAQTWRLSECPYVRRDARDAWRAGAWAWMNEQRAHECHDNACRLDSPHAGPCDMEIYTR